MHNSRASARRAVVFDLDGTLVNSEGDIVTSFLQAFSEHSLEPPQQDEVVKLIGAPLDEMYATFAPDELVHKLSASYREHYAQNFTATTRPYAGVPEVLALLKERGYLLVIATTKGTEMASSLLTALELRSHIDHVQGTDGFPPKPSPEVILRALAAVGAEGTAMVGDTARDVHAGAAAGLLTYGVTWGAGSAHALSAAGADVVASDLSELPALLT